MVRTFVLTTLGLVGCRAEVAGKGDTSGTDGVVDSDGDGYPESEDCDDTAPETNPGATEVCDGIDNDCDAEIDEGVMDWWYADVDEDGYGDADAGVQACDGPSGYVPSSTDCDDTDSAVYPSADEVCNGVDDDCNGQIDEGVTERWYQDLDGDGFGDPDAPVDACVQPDGTADNADDCDDTSAAAYPSALEICDGVDNDCDTLTDEDDAVDAAVWFADVDGDGFGDPDSTAQACSTPTGYVDQSRDCDDLNPDIRPDAPEVCDGIDNDCDDLTDDDDPGVDTAAGGVWYTDADADGFGDSGSPVAACDQPSGTVSDDTDCDDTDGGVFPTATEICDGDDEDCDGLIDDDDPSLDVSTAAVWYADTDGDGYGDASASTTACTQPSGSVADDTDCDDTDAGVSPADDEICDGLVDEDCDGTVDEDDAVDALIWYADTDGDGYGDASASTTACIEPSGYVADDTDCDDGDSSLSICTSCYDLLAAGHGTTDGVYSLDPCGTGSAADYWCDMTTDGGGWTVAGWQGASATSSLGVSDWGAVGDTAWSSDLACIDFSEIMVENHTLGQVFQQSYSLQTWSATAINLTVGTSGTAFKHGTYGPSGSQIVMGCVDYLYGSGTYNQFACDSDGTRSAKGHLADYAGEYCSGGRLDYTWAWSNGSTCTSRGTAYTWGYAIR